MHLSAALVLIAAMINNVHPLPAPIIRYFPDRAHPWAVDDDADNLNSVGSYKESLGYFHDNPLPKNKLGVKYVYPKAQEGFVPADLTALNSVYWWKKRYGSSAVDDVPYFPDDKNDFADMRSGIKKRDYTAAQLVNMLKALAKTRRQRQIRIAGKGLRFGISK